MSDRRKTVGVGRPRVSGERGSATVWVLALAGVLAVLGAGFILVGAAMVARHRATTAADLAALAAAGRAAAGDPAPCEVARRIAGQNTAELDTCTLAPGAVVEVTVSVPVRLGRLGVYSATARARAGPVAPGSAGGSDDGAVGAPAGRPPSAGGGRAGGRLPSGDVPAGGVGAGPVVGSVGGSQFVQDDVQHPHGAGLVQRVVAVAALG